MRQICNNLKAYYPWQISCLVVRLKLECFAISSKYNLKVSIKISCVLMYLYFSLICCFFVQKRGIGAVKYLMFSDHSMVKRAATEVFCNIAGFDQFIEVSTNDYICCFLSLFVLIMEYILFSIE